MSPSNAPALPIEQERTARGRRADKARTEDFPSHLEAVLRSIQSKTDETTQRNPKISGGPINWAEFNEAVAELPPSERVALTTFGNLGGEAIALNATRSYKVLDPGGIDGVRRTPESDTFSRVKVDYANFKQERIKEVERQILALEEVTGLRVMNFDELKTLALAMNPDAEASIVDDYLSTVVFPHRDWLKHKWHINGGGTSIIDYNSTESRFHAIGSTYVREGGRRTRDGWSFLKPEHADSHGLNSGRIAWVLEIPKL